MINSEPDLYFAEENKALPNCNFKSSINLPKTHFIKVSFLTNKQINMFFKLKFIVICGIIISQIHTKTNAQIVAVVEVGTKHIQYPRLPFFDTPIDAKTYSIVLNDKELNVDENPTLDIYFLMQGYKRVNANGDLKIILKQEKQGEFLSKTSRQYEGKDGDNESYEFYALNYQPSLWSLKIMADTDTVYQEQSRTEPLLAQFGKNKYLKADELAALWGQKQEAYLDIVKEKYNKEILQWASNRIQNHSLMYAYFVQILPDIQSEIHNYDDFNEATAYFLKGLAQIESERIAVGNVIIVESKSQKEEHLRKAIQIWESALAEYDPKKKRARIYKKVAKWACIYLAYSYTWLEEFDNAETYLIKAKEINAKRMAAPDLERVNQFFKVQKKRFTNTMIDRETSPNGYTIVDNEMVLTDKTITKYKPGIKIGLNPELLQSLINKTGNNR